MANAGPDVSRFGLGACIDWVIEPEAFWYPHQNREIK